MVRMPGKLFVLCGLSLGLIVLGWVAMRSRSSLVKGQPLEGTGVSTTPLAEFKPEEVEPPQVDGPRQPGTLVDQSPVSESSPPPRPQVSEGPRKGLDVLADNVQEMRRLFLEHKSNGSAMFLIERSVYLREDILGQSYSLDQPIPAAVNKRDFWIAVNGPNGRRFYQFGKDEYPLYWKYSELDQASAASHAAIVGQHDMEEVLAFADETLAMFEGPLRK